MNNEDRLLKKHFKDLINKSYKENIYTFTDFLNAAELSDFLTVAKEEGCSSYSLYNEDDNLERQMVRIGLEEDFGYTEEFPIKILKVSPLNKKFSDDFTHRDFLGALMNLGIERKTLGDIFITDREAFVFCHNKVADFIIDNLDKVKHTNVKVTIADQANELPKSEPVAENLIVSSYRADLTICKAYNLSRSLALEMFVSHKIYLNSKLLENNSCILKDGDMVSVRGYGRFKFNKTLGNTKKGKYLVEILKY